ncbi:MAG: ABC transporter ATP-binding protein [Bacteroidota bacterium]|nr:ABC transporter ATP-binding protein [Bacteroidota bacterium]
MPAIQIEHLWKTYKRGKTRLGSLRSSASYMWSRMGRQEEDFNALEEINLIVNEGEVLGIVGHNGAGKSTLLKLLSRITSPTKGRIIITGKLSSLLEAGVGFHPELSGRDNIYLSGIIHGMKQKEIDERFESIVHFSGQELYLDTPVKHYSSGMAVRLAFAVSAHLNPDIFIMDEMLVTADQEFRQKSNVRVKELISHGKTILLVSHQMDYLRDMCTRAICLNHGKIVSEGPVNDVIDQYLFQSSTGPSQSIGTRKDRQGSGKIIINEISLQNTKEENIQQANSGEELKIVLHITNPSSKTDNASVKMNCHDALGRQWFVINSKISNGLLALVEGRNKLICTIPKLTLGPGKYTFDVSLSLGNNISDALQNAFELSVLPGPFYKTGILPLDTNGMLVDYDWDTRINNS